MKSRVMTRRCVHASVPRRNPRMSPATRPETTTARARRGTRASGRRRSRASFVVDRGRSVRRRAREGTREEAGEDGDLGGSVEGDAIERGRWTRGELWGRVVRSETRESVREPRVVRARDDGGRYASRR
jgi:hypothetical protein